MNGTRSQVAGTPVAKEGLSSTMPKKKSSLVVDRFHRTAVGYRGARFRESKGVEVSAVSLMELPAPVPGLT
jgi:hypothetical protein